MVDVAVAGIDVFAVILSVHGAGREALDVHISVANGNHDAVAIDTIQLVCLLAHTQNTHLLQQVEVQTFLLAVCQNLAPILRRKAEALLFAVLAIHRESI